MTLAERMREQVRMECGRKDPAQCDNHDWHRLMGEGADALERIETLATEWEGEEEASRTMSIVQLRPGAYARRLREAVEGKKP